VLLSTRKLPSLLELSVQEIQIWDRKNHNRDVLTKMRFVGAAGSWPAVVAVAVVVQAEDPPGLNARSR